MIVLRILPLLAAIAASGMSAQEPVASPSTDNTLLVQAVAGSTLDLAMRGTRVSVVARAAAVEGECAMRLTAHGQTNDRRWRRIFRWEDLAWTGVTADGRTMAAFHEDEGRMAVDTLTFAPADPGAFTAALARAATACREARAESERILVGGSGGERMCYFARWPGLQIVEPAPGPGAPPARAMLSILSRENPEAELHLLFERNDNGGNDAGDDDEARPDVAFTYADPRLTQLGIMDARFALDEQLVAASHALAIYGDTRVRIGMDPPRQGGGEGSAPRFYHRLASSGNVSMTLLDAARQTKARLTFNAGPTLAAARRALKAANWSCEGALPAQTPAAQWTRADEA